MQRPYLLPFLVTCLLLAGLSLTRADEIKLKSGETITGTITYEADDIVKIEVTISASIKETKIIGRSDIASITKESPDSVALKKMEELLPVGSMTSAGAYNTLIETGPDSFLRLYPDSVHAERVKEIKAQLDEELDKVERGFIKIEEDWISPQEQAEFETLVKSRIQFLRMEAAGRTGNYNGIISAMREFEVIEEKYYGTPAFPKALELALQAIPSLGQNLQGMLRDVEYRNAEYERNKAALTEEAKAQVDAALQREEANYQAGLAADKKAGIKWVRLNPRSKASIEGYLKLAGAELTRIREFDLVQLKTQAEKLVEVDQLIAKGNYDLARTKLTDAAAITGKTASSKSSSKSSSKGSKSGNYIAALSSKLNERVSAEAAKAKAREEAAKSQALAANLKKAEKGADEEAATEEAPMKEEGAEAAEETPEAAPEDLFAALAKADPSKEKADEKKSTKSSKSDKDEKEDKDDRDKDRPRPAVVEESGGFSFSLIIPIITVLLVITVVLLKVLGIGAKKESSDE